VVARDGERRPRLPAEVEAVEVERPVLVLVDVRVDAGRAVHAAEHVQRAPDEAAACAPRRSGRDGPRV
jgi:hypothetical protein